VEHIFAQGGSLITVSKELSKYKLDLVGVHEVRWDEGGTEPAGEYTFFCRKGTLNHEFGTGFFGHKRVISAATRAELVIGRLSYIILRGRWFDTIVLNIHAPTENKIYDVKGSFYEKLKRVSYKHPKFHTKIVLGYFNAKVGTEDIFNRQVGMNVYTKFVMTMELE
jgi:hypothetical protein